jgi:hypothetical protein
LKEFPTLAWPENIYHYKCSPSLSDAETMKKWHEYQEKRDYKTICKDIESGSMSNELVRVAEFCNWIPFRSSKKTNCKAPANTTMQFQYQLEPHWVTGNHVYEGKEVPALFNLTDKLRECGPHVFTFTYVWKMCTWHFTLRYDATAQGLVHGSLLGTNTCNYPDTYAYYSTDIVTLWPSP